MQKEQIFLWLELGNIKWNKPGTERQILQWCQSKKQTRYQDGDEYGGKMDERKMANGYIWIQGLASNLL